MFLSDSFNQLGKKDPTIINYLTIQLPILKCMLMQLKNAMN